MYTDNIMIFEKDLLLAHRICAFITDPERRNRAVANVVAAKIAAEYFDSANYEIDTQSGLHNIAYISEPFEIADLYVNGAYIDVRVYFSDEEMNVPKVHFDSGVLPVAYMFVKLSENLKEASVTGFMYPESVDKSRLKGDFYPVTLNDLCNLYDIEMRLQKKPDIANIDNAQIYELLEGTIEGQAVIDLFKVLVTSKSSRVKLVKAAKAQSVFNFVSTPDKMSQDAAPQLEQVEEVVTEIVPAVSEEVVSDDDADITDEDLDSLFDTVEDSAQNEVEDFATEITPSGSDVIESLDKEAAANEQMIQENSEQIETLFTGEQQGVPVAKKKKGSFLPVLLLAALIGGGAYFWYNHQSNNQLANDDFISSQSNVADVDSETQEDFSQQENSEQKADAMPVETVEDTKPVANKEESTSVAIPAIERNLDASILVSNLKIDWEVPEGYASNTAAKRYLVKLGKVIQLDLKTELLLLNKPPLSNKITVELTYNPSMNRFEVVGIQMSSGEKTVDDAILRTVKAALTYSMSATMESFAKLQGNPVLIINL